jgi:hypothetical protein
MTHAVFAHASDLTQEDYVLFGLATCFIKQDGEVFEVKVVEPIPSAALEAILKGIATSYDRLTAATLGAVLADAAPQLPAGFPDEAQFCDDFVDRTLAAARTYKSRPEAMTYVPLGTSRTDLNHSTERKRVLNSDRIVKTEDNIKQHAYTHQTL